MFHIFVLAVMSSQSLQFFCTYKTKKKWKDQQETDLCTRPIFSFLVLRKFSEKGNTFQMQSILWFLLKKTLKFMWRFCQEVISQTSQIGCRQHRKVCLLVFCCTNYQHIILKQNFCNLKLSHNNFIFEKRIGFQRRCGWLNLNVSWNKETKKDNQLDIAG